MGRLADLIRDFGRKVRSSPALAVGPELDRLVAAADRDDDATGYAYKSPVANLTWMQRGILYRTDVASAQLPMTIPFACKIVQCKVVTLLAEADLEIDYVEPPLSAIDVVLTLNRSENYTARQDKLVTANQDTRVVSLESFNDQIRSLELTLNAEDNILAVQYRWAVDLTTVERFGWGNVQISMNWAVDPKIRWGEERFAKPAA